MSAKYLNNNQKMKNLKVKMSRKIIDFSHNGIEIPKQKPIRAVKPFVAKTLRGASLRSQVMRSSMQGPVHGSKTPPKSKLLHPKKSRARPQSSSTYATSRHRAGISRMTTQGSYTSTRQGVKNSLFKSRESHIKYLAEHKNR